MIIIDSREKKGSLLVDLVESKAKSLNIKTEKKLKDVQLVYLLRSYNLIREINNVSK